MLAHGYVWRISVKLRQFGGGFQFPVFSTHGGWRLRVFPSLPCQWFKARLEVEGEEGKGKIITTILSHEGLGIAIISRSIFQWPLICSFWFSVPNHLSVKMIKIQQAPWIWLQNQLWSWSWLQDHNENVDGDWPATIMKALTCRLLGNHLEGDGIFYELAREVTVETFLHQSCFALVCISITADQNVKSVKFNQ